MLHGLGSNGLGRDALPLIQVEVHKVAYLLPRYLRLRCLGNSRREIVWHAFVDIQLHWNTGSVEGLVQPNETAQKDLLCPTLNQGRRKALGEVAVYRRSVGIF